jgi:hypothetical protein
MFRARLATATAATACALALAPGAGAASKPIQQGYGNPAVKVARSAGVLGAQYTARRSAATAPAATAVARRSTLPFTGLDLALLAAGGAGLLLLGASLRRLGRARM